MRISYVATACCAATLFGCSSHPLVEDFARKDTYAIVQKIRCEAHNAVEKTVVKDKHGKVIDGDARTQALSNYIIGFDFKLDITEKNNASGGKVDFTNPFMGGKFTLALSGGAEKTRQSERFFRTIETLGSLNALKGCSLDDGEANLIYPITGYIGMEEVLYTFLDLEKDKNLVQEDRKGGGGASGKSKTGGAPGGGGDGSGGEGAGGKGGKGTGKGRNQYTADTNNTNNKGAAANPYESYHSVFSDTLTFTTKLNAGVKPSLEVAAGTGAIKLTNFTIDGSVERIDEHQVSVAISRKTPPGDSIIFPGRSRNNEFGYLVAGVTNNEAADVIAELNRLRNRDDDEVVLQNLRLLPE